MLYTGPIFGFSTTCNTLYKLKFFNQKINFPNHFLKHHMSLFSPFKTPTSFSPKYKTKQEIRICPPQILIGTNWRPTTPSPSQISRNKRVHFCALCWAMCWPAASCDLGEVWGYCMGSLLFFGTCCCLLMVEGERVGKMGLQGVFLIEGNTFRYRGH